MSAVLDRARQRFAPLSEGAKRLREAGPPPVRYGGLALALFVLWFALDHLLPRGIPVGIIVLGLVFGSLYSLGAIGIVLIYRANRIVNFAQAEFGSVAAVLAIEFVFRYGMNYFLAIGAGLIIALAMGALINTAIIRRFRRAPRLIVAVATIGIAQILNGLAIIIPILFERAIVARQFTTPFKAQFTIFPVIYNGNHVFAMVTVPIVMIALGAFLRYSSYGIAIRAAAENGDRASLLGVPVPRLSTVVWAIAAFLSALAVILRVPILGFSSFTSVSGGGNSLLLRTLAAAVIGRMESLPRAVLGALALGVFQEAASWTYSNTDFVDALLVIVILVSLLLQRDFFKRAQETGISTWKAIKEIRPIPDELKKLPEVRIGFGVLKLALLGFAIAVPVWARPSQEQALSLILIYSMVAISLLILTGWAGHISLGQFAFVGFGGAATAAVYTKLGWDFFLALPVGVIAAALVALIIGLPALRIRGPFLAVTTLAFAVTSSSYFLEDRYFPWFISDQVTRPTLWGRLNLDQEWQMYYLSLVALLFVMLCVRNLRRSRTGRALIAVRDNELAAETVTIDTTRLKLVAFVISGGIAGFAGSFYVLHQKGVFTGSYGSAVSVRLFSMVVIGGLGSLPGAVLGAVYVRGAEFFLPPGYALIVSGIGILALLIFLPEGLGGAVYGIRDTILRRVAKRRGLVVPSLLADVRVDQEQAPIALGAALGGVSGASDNGARATRPALTGRKD